MSAPNTVTVLDIEFAETDLFAGLEWIEQQAGLDVIAAALGVNRELACLHLCLAACELHQPASLRAIRRLAEGRW